MSFETAYAALQRARRTHEEALDEFNHFEATKGLSSAEADTCEKERVFPASDKADEAAKALLKTPARTQGQMLKKVAALMEEAMTSEDVQALKDEAEALTVPDRDPVVPLCKRWLTIHAKIADLLQHLPDGAGVEPPEIEEAEEKLHELEAEIRKLTPVSPEGLALLTTVQWKTDGPCHLVGTEEWARSLDAPEYVLMRRLRYGAHIVAGLEP